MEPTRGNRFRSIDNSPHDLETPSCLTAFLRSSHLPSFQEVRTLTQPPPPLPLPAETDELRGHYEMIERVLND